MSSSLSSVVSNLVRSSMGTSVSNTVTEEDLDRHVAELILKEAKQKAAKYSQQGMRAFLPDLADSNAPRANKRFLSSIIRSTDDHNKTILRAQALAAQEIKKEREEAERRERRARAEEAVAAEKRRRRLKRQKFDDDDDDWDRGREHTRKKRERSWERREHSDGEGDHHAEDRPSEKRRRHRDRPRSGERSSRRKRERSSRKSSGARDDHPRLSRRRERERSPPSGDDSDHSKRDDYKRRSRHRHHSHKSRHRLRSSRHRPSPSRKDGHVEDHDRTESKYPKQRSLSQSSETEIEVTESELNHKHRGRPPLQRHRDSSRGPPLSPKPGSSYSISDSTPIQREISPTPQLPSKMDKYFEETYDPRLDVAPLTVPKVPATGLIDNSEFEGWDAMLELIRIRKEDKDEKKRMERLGLSKDKQKLKSMAGGSEDRWGGESISIMDIAYKKRGSVREWDLGKEGFE